MITQLNKIKDKKIQAKLKVIVEAILSMRGRITMLGIARWNGKYSYRTIERFFDMKIDWLGIKWELITTPSPKTSSTIPMNHRKIGYLVKSIQIKNIKRDFRLQF